jgi:hypothetical protein
LGRKGVINLRTFAQDASQAVENCERKGRRKVAGPHTVDLLARCFFTATYNRGEKLMFKFIVIFGVGCACGVFGTMYHYDSKFAAQANAHIDSAVSQAATSAHTALNSK